MNTKEDLNVESDDMVIQSSYQANIMKSDISYPL